MHRLAAVVVAVGVLSIAPARAQQGATALERQAEASLARWHG